MNNASSTPLSEEAVYVAFLKDLEAAVEPERVIADYASRYPHLADELREMAGMQRKLDHSQTREEPRSEHPGQLGDFRITRPIAEGGMGTIYEAIQQPLNRRVAVKTIRDRKRHLTGMLHSRFLREQQVLAQLHHTHIVPIHAAGHDGGLQYFAMSYIDGAALHHVVRIARLHEMSSRQNHGRTPTPTLAALAAEARSSTPSRDTHDRNAAHHQRKGQEKPPEYSTSTTVSQIEPPLVRDETAKPSTNGKLVLSPEYFRSVARVMIDAAEALQHAHDAGIIHRDLKPSNLMVDTSEHCWVLDFGLAGYLRAQIQASGEAAPPPRTGPTPDLGPDPPTVSGIFGTLDYMAPEQFQGRADARTDVWGLGVILYELLTLRRPFLDRSSFETTDAPRPRDMVQGLPRDLEAVCLKAMRKEPGNRYRSARDLAQDLRRWLGSEPVTARKASTLRRLSLWARRNKGWAAAIMVTALAILSLGAGGVILARKAQAEAEQKRHELLLQSIQQRRTSPHHDGWFEDLWGQIRQIAKPGDSALQSQAAASLFGLDAKRSKEFKNFGAFFLALDPKGEKLLLGGVEDSKKRGSFLRNQLVTDEFQTTRDLATSTLGPVAFRRDGTPVQLVPDEGKNGKPDTLVLLDLNSGKTLTAFELPAGTLGTRSETQVGLFLDGKLAAAPVKDKDGKDSLMVWDAETGRLKRSFAWRSSAIAFALDGTLVASGAPEGRIMVWSLETGEVVAQLGAGRMEIQCLTFGRDPLHRLPNPRSARLEPGRLLAAGDKGAVVTIYDLGRRQARSICRGSTNEIFGVAFSPDGSTLASCGRVPMHLWDVATGRQLLTLHMGDYAFGLAFTPDGRRLVVSAPTVWAPGSVIALELDQGRGIRDFRGLTGLIAQVKFSPDGHRLAALSHDWQVGVWERESGRLLGVFDAPQGRFIDNVGLAFSPDGHSLAFSGGHEARLWNLDTAEERAWSFRQGEIDHEGLQDRLAFVGPGRLISARVETKSGAGWPPRDHPNVARIRNLLAPEPLKPISEITELEAVEGDALTPDGRFLVLGGFTGPRGHIKHLVNNYEIATRKRLWSQEVDLPDPLHSQALRLDPPGALLMYRQSLEPVRINLLEIATGRLVRSATEFDALGPDATLGLTSGHPSPEAPDGFTFWQRDRGRDRVLFGLEFDAILQRPGSSFSEFTRDGRFAGIGNADGSVLVVDLVDVNRRLTELGLGW